MLCAIEPELAEIDTETAVQLKNDAIYSAYAQRQDRDAESIRRDEARRLPMDLDYASLPGLSNELRQKLEAARPRSVGEAGKIEGMTAAEMLLLINASRRAAA